MMREFTIEILDESPVAQKFKIIINSSINKITEKEDGIKLIQFCTSNPESVEFFEK